MEKTFESLRIPEKQLQEMQKYLKGSLESKKIYQYQIFEGLKKKEKNAQEKLDRLLDLRLNGSITEDEYNKKAKSLREEQIEIQVEKKMHDGADEKFAMTLSYLLTVCSKAHEIFKSSKVEQKRALINFVLSNPSLKRGKLVYTYKKPFDVISKGSNCLEWLLRSDSN